MSIIEERRFNFQQLVKEVNDHPSTFYFPYKNDDVVSWVFNYPKFYEKFNGKDEQKQFFQRVLGCQSVGKHFLFYELAKKIFEDFLSFNKIPLYLKGVNKDIYIINRDILTQFNLGKQTKLFVYGNDRSVKFDDNDVDNFARTSFYSNLRYSVLNFELPDNKNEKMCIVLFGYAEKYFEKIREEITKEFDFVTFVKFSELLFTTSRLEQLSFDKKIKKLNQSLNKFYRDDTLHIFTNEDTLKWIMGDNNYYQKDNKWWNQELFDRIITPEIKAIDPIDLYALGEISRHIFSEYLKINKFIVTERNNFMDTYTYFKNAEIETISVLIYNNKIYETSTLEEHIDSALVTVVVNEKSVYNIVLIGEFEKEFSDKEDHYRKLYPKTVFWKFSDLLLDTPGLEEVKKLFKHKNYYVKPKEIRSESESTKLIPFTEGESKKLTGITFGEAVIERIQEQDTKTDENLELQQQIDEIHKIVNDFKSWEDPNDLLPNREVISWCLGDTSFLEKETLYYEEEWRHNKFSTYLKAFSKRIILNYLHVKNGIQANLAESYSPDNGHCHLFTDDIFYFIVASPNLSYKFSDYEKDFPENVEIMMNFVEEKQRKFKKINFIFMGRCERDYRKFFNENPEIAKEYHGEDKFIECLYLSDLLKDLILPKTEEKLQKNLKIYPDTYINNKTMQQQNEFKNEIEQISKMAQGKKYLGNPEVISWCFGDLSFLGDNITYGTESAWLTLLDKNIQLNEYEKYPRNEFNIFTRKLIGEYIEVNAKGKYSTNIQGNVGRYKYQYAVHQQNKITYFMLSNLWTTKYTFDLERLETTSRNVMNSASLIPYIEFIDSEHKHTEYVYKLVLLGHCEKNFRALFKYNPGLQEQLSEKYNISYVFFSDLLKDLITEKNKEQIPNEIVSEKCTENEDLDTIEIVKTETQDEISISIFEDDIRRVYNKIPKHPDSIIWINKRDIIRWLFTNEFTDGYDEKSWIKDLSRDQTYCDLYSLYKGIIDDFYKIENNFAGHRSFLYNEVISKEIIDNAVSCLSGFTKYKNKVLIIIGKAERKLDSILEKYPYLKDTFRGVKIVKFTDILREYAGIIPKQIEIVENNSNVVIQEVPLYQRMAKYSYFFNKREVIQWLNDDKSFLIDISELEWFKQFNESIRGTYDFVDLVWNEYKKLTKTKIGVMIYDRGIEVNVHNVKNKGDWLSNGNSNPNLKTLVFIGEAEKKFKNLCSEYPEFKTTLMSDYPEVTFANFTELLISFLEGQVSDSETEPLISQDVEMGEPEICQETSNDCVVTFPANLEESEFIPLREADSDAITTDNLMPPLIDNSVKTDEIKEADTILRIRLAAKEDNMKFQIRLAAKDQVINELEMQCSVKDQTISELTVALEDFASVRNAYCLLDKSLKEEKDKNYWLKMSLDAAKDNFENIKIELQNVQNDKVQMQNEFESTRTYLLDQISSLRIEIDRMRHSHDAAQNEILDASNDTLELLENKIKEQQEEITKGKQREEILTQTVQKHLEHAMDIQQYNRKMYDDNQRLQNEANEAKREAEFAADYNKETVARYQLAISEGAKEKETEIAKLSAVIEEKDKDILRLQSEIDNKSIQSGDDDYKEIQKLRSDVQMKSVLNDNLLKENGILKTRNNDLEEEIAKLRKKDIGDAIKEICSLRNEIEGKDLIIENFSVRNLSLADQVVYLTKQVTTLESNKEKIEEILEPLRNNLKFHQEKHNEYKQQVDKMEKENVILKAEVGKISKGKDIFIEDALKNLEKDVILGAEIVKISKGKDKMISELEKKTRELSETTTVLQNEISELKGEPKPETKDVETITTNSDGNTIIIPESLSDISLSTDEDDYDMVDPYKQL